MMVRITLTLPEIMKAQAEGSSFWMSYQRIEVGPVSFNGSVFTCSLHGDNNMVVGIIEGPAETTLNVFREDVW